MTVVESWPLVEVRLKKKLSGARSFVGIQLSRAKGCQKKCTRQSRKVLWVVFSSLFFKEISKNGKKGHVCLRVLKESNKSRFESYSVGNKCIDHIPY